ncbi:helix-turn-helix domain-containing protein [Chryseobacterium sp. MIQD13]|uniref:helix-turn-helix domain-containing protein n=1 Tax=Chryseobacterium sp. MIQD13 TaxID=3422310 RepID=UPI003D29F68B
MKSKETLSEFYALHGQEYAKTGQFNVYRREDFACSQQLQPVYRRDFYKISMISEGTGIVNYADKSIKIDRPAVTFLNPLIPYSWEPTSVNQSGYFCLFTEEFVSQTLKNESLSQSVLFKAGGDHIFFPDDESLALLKTVYENMMHEIQSDYLHKYDLIRSYVQIIMHEAMKMQPSASFYRHTNASERISTLFLDLLDRQFFIDSPEQIITLKNANEFAEQLNVHTNHLNRALKETTGKTTTTLISDRMIKEAKSLLQFSNWNINEIAYCLGFEHSSNFNVFFKKQTGDSPNQFRKRIVSIS